MNSNNNNIVNKILEKKPINEKEAIKLFDVPLPTLGQLATQIKKEISKDYVFFVVNRQINPTNICILNCKFCEYSTRLGSKNGYELSIEEILSKLSEDINEVHIVSALHPKWNFDKYLDIVRAIKEKFPNIKIKAYTAVEVWHFSKISGLSIEEVLYRLKEAGVSALPGGGAEVFSDRIRKELFPQKIGYKDYLHIHRIAHKIGLKSNATLLYGHIETKEEIIRHLFLLRELQEETGGFMAFIPLEYKLGRKKIVKRAASPIYTLQIMAISRIILQNFPHIKAYWASLGEELTEISLHYGASDIDGTIGEEKIMHSAGADSPLALQKEKLIHLISSAGYIPAERDAVYNIIKVYDNISNNS